MITPYLESLIIKGQATFKTFVAGGATDKHVLNIEQDRYIVITDLTYFSHLYQRPQNLANMGETIDVSGFNTQLTILGEKGFNRYVFRNSFNTVQVGNLESRATHNVPHGHVKMDCYLIHTNKVSFNFSRSLVFNAGLSAIAPPNVPAYPTPMDYGKEGQTGAINSLRNMAYNLPPFSWLIDNQEENLPPVGSEQYIQKEFSYPVLNGFTDMSNFLIMKEQYGAPILHVNYVEIKGLPNNINSK